MLVQSFTAHMPLLTAVAEGQCEYIVYCVGGGRRGDFHWKRSCHLLMLLPSLITDGAP